MRPDATVFHPAASFLSEMDGVMATRIVKVEPFDLVVFGGAGDLAHRKLYPALFHRDLSNQFSEPTRII